MIVLARHDELDLAAYRRVVLAHEAVGLADELLATVDATRVAMLAHVERGAPAYGINTGLGYLTSRAVEPGDQRALQRTILVGRAAAVGPPLADCVVRGAMLLRLVGFLSGHPGVSSALCRFIADRLNDGWAPVVPASPTGAAGEIVPLAHLFGTFIGEGDVREGPAAQALAARGLAPYEPGAKEGLALINGAPLAPALAVPLALRAEWLLEHATLAGALTVALVGASTRPYSVRVGELKGDPAQRRVHRRLGELLAGGERRGDALQAPVSLRVLPQVHGATLDLLDHLGAQLGRELRAVTDSPVFLAAEGEEPEGLYSTGNFHAHAVTLLLDALAIALTHVLDLGEKRLHRLLDARFSGLPEQLARDPGRHSGLVIVHKQVIGLVAECRTLAAPAGVHAADGSSGQEDFQAHTLLVALKLERILDALELALSYELVALRQARELRGAPAAPALERALAELTALVPEIGEDRALAADVERVRGLVRSGALIGDRGRGAPRITQVN